MKQRRFYLVDLFLLACVLLAATAAYAGGALGYLIGVVTVGVGLIVSILQRILVAVRQPAAAPRGLGLAAGGTARGEAHLESLASGAEPTPRQGAVQTGGGAAAAMRGAAQHDGQARR